MKEWKRKVFYFVTTMGLTVAGLVPAAGCTGGCAGCFHCAGLGGTGAILAAIGLLKRKRQRANAAVCSVSKEEISGTGKKTGLSR